MAGAGEGEEGKGGRGRGMGRGVEGAKGWVGSEDKQGWEMGGGRG